MRGVEISETQGPYGLSKFDEKFFRERSKWTRRLKADCDYWNILVNQGPDPRKRSKNAAAQNWHSAACRVPNYLPGKTGRTMLRRKRFHGSTVFGGAAPNTIHNALKSCSLGEAWEESCMDRNVWRTIRYNNTGIFQLNGSRGQSRDTEPLVYDICGRGITSWIGVQSHMRAHLRRNEVNWWWHRDLRVRAWLLLHSYHWKQEVLVNMS